MAKSHLIHQPLVLNDWSGTKQCGGQTRIGELRGRIRGLEVEWTQDAIHRVTIANTILKQCVRQLTVDNCTLDMGGAPSRTRCTTVTD